MGSSSTAATRPSLGKKHPAESGCRSIGHSPTASVQKQRRRRPPWTTKPGRPRHGINH